MYSIIDSYCPLCSFNSFALFQSWEKVNPFPLASGADRHYTISKYNAAWIEKETAYQSIIYASNMSLQQFFNTVINI